MVKRRPAAFVAGASRGLGLLIARELSQRGFRVVIAARDPGELDRAAAWLAESGHQVVTEACDVADAGQVADAVDRIERDVGPIEVMICVAGIIQVGPLRSVTRQHFSDAIDVMLWGPINTALAVLPGMRERGSGKIGVIASVGGLIAAPHLLPYSTAKFGAVGFGRGLRSELAGTGVSVTTVTPGLMRTGSHVRAEFVGRYRQEYAWFAAAASIPLLSMDAERAARRIVDGVLAGRSVVVLTPLAKIAPRIDALFPRSTSALLGLTARLLPDAPGAAASTGTVEGRRAAAQLDPLPRRLLDAVTRWGLRAARRFNERPDRIDEGSLG